VDLLIPSSRYYAERMQARLGLPTERTRVVYNGINLSGYSPAPAPPEPPVLGYLARMCRENGPQDRCLLYVFRCAVYYASTARPSPAKLRWWNWKDG
jgi:hypothetical protein